MSDVITRYLLNLDGRDKLLRTIQYSFRALQFYYLREDGDSATELIGMLKILNETGSGMNTIEKILKLTGHAVALQSSSQVFPALKDSRPKLLSYKFRVLGSGSKFILALSAFFKAWQKRSEAERSEQVAIAEGGGSSGAKKAGTIALLLLAVVKEFGDVVVYASNANYYKIHDGWVGIWGTIASLCAANKVVNKVR